MNRKRAPILATLLLAALCSAPFSNQSRTLRAQIPAMSFTVVANEYTGGPAGPESLIATYITGVSADGSRAEIVQSFNKDGAATHRVRTIRYADGRYAKVLDHLKMKYSLVRTREWFATVRASAASPATDCTNDSTGGFHRTLKAIGHKTLNVPGGGTIAVTLIDGHGIYADAPSLGCENLEHDVALGGGDYSKKRLASLTYGEPDRALFAIPTNYREARPSEIMQSNMAEQLDAMYAKFAHWQ